MSKQDRSTILRAALAALETGEVARALALVEPFTRRNPTDADAQALLGQALSIAGKSHEAIAAFEAACALRPDRAGFRFNLGMAHLGAGQFGQAVDVLTPLTAMSADDAELWEALGAAHLGLHDPAAAIECLKRALTIAPDHMTAHTHMGDALQKSGDADGAVQAYRKALALAPDHVPALNNLGAALIERGALQEARDLLERATKQDRQHTRARINLGMAQLHLENPKAALEAFNDCLRIDPLNRWGIAYRDLTRLQLGELKPNGFADALRPLISQDDLRAPYEGFEQDLAAELNSHPNRRRDVAGTATTNGDDALDLFSHKGPALEALEVLLRQAIDRRIAQIEFTPGHPLFGWKPEAYRLDIWATFLRSGGYQYAHIHPTGWLSGVYYVQLPSSDGAGGMGAGGDNHDIAGWIEFGPPDISFPITARPEPMHFEPKVRRLLLFPSYAYHRTIPFEGASDRISIAFDVRPR